jgi:hypothetical protein
LECETLDEILDLKSKIKDEHSKGQSKKDRDAKSQIEGVVYG